MTTLWLAMLVGCGAGEPEVPKVDGGMVEAPRDGRGRQAERKDKRRKPERGGKRRRGDMPVDRWPQGGDPCADRAEAGSYMYRFEHDDVLYEVPIWVGEGEGPRDLLFMLHGGKGSAPSILKKTGFHDKAMEEGFVAVAPAAADIAGSGTRWNSGKFDKELEKRLKPGDTVRDDVAFLDALAKDLRKAVCADKVVTTGFSSGGQMSNAWACKGTQVDAVIAAAGALLTPDKRCKKGVPILSYVGVRDDVYKRGPMEDDPDQPSVPKSMELWAKKNGCKSKPAAKKVQEATCFTYRECKQPTQLCVVERMGHQWPAPWSKDPVDFDGTEYGWDWYRNKVDR